MSFSFAAIARLAFVRATTVGLLLVSAVHAAVSIETVFVGHAGNPDDSTPYGGVSYNYYIGTYEVTNAQYTAFLNSVAATDTHGLYDVAMGGWGITQSGSSGTYTYSTSLPNRPVNAVSFWDAARFANWLTNGQPVGAQGGGTTETGVYSLGGVTNPANNSVTRNSSAWASGGVAVASEDEWYKAAYYDPSPSGPADDYWRYPTRSDVAPLAIGGNSINANSANYNNAVGTLTNVGSYSIASSYYGTFDQGGNVYEWLDEIYDSSSRLRRGGGYTNNEDVLQGGYSELPTAPATAYTNTGFRISSLAAIPEPAHIGSVLGALGLLIAFRLKPRRTRCDNIGP